MIFSQQDPAAEWAALSDDIAKTNLVRMWWLLLTSTSLSVAFIIANVFVLKEPNFFSWQTLDVGGSFIFLILIWLCRRGMLSPRFSRGLAIAYFAFWLVLMDGYYFAALGRYGETATYALGVVTPALLILLPPRAFLSLLLPNHIIFSAILLYTAATTDRVGDVMYASFANGTLGVLVAGLGAWFLFSARRANFRYERLLREKNQEVRSAASNLQAMLENIPFQAWLLDVNGKFLAVNGEFVEATGLPHHEIVGKTLHDLYSQERADQYRREDIEIMETREKAYFEQSLPTLTDSLIWHEVFKSPVTDDNGHVVGTVGLARNITERKEIEERLQVADKAKSEFLAVMSHEIRTPMNIVLGYANLLRDMPMEGTQRDHVESILHSGQLLLSIINDILDFSKIEAGKLPLQEEPIHLREMVTNLTKMFQPLAGQKGFALKASVETDVPQVLLSDFHRIEQILVNLLSNAVKFTEVGSVTLSISAQVVDETRNLWEIFFKVTDTGIGITSEQMSRLFQPFTQADTTMARRYSGTGLGLVIVRRLCELMGGSIEVETKAGEGSTFIASICAQEVCQTPNAGLHPAATDDVETDISRRRVLVVEDNFSNRKLIAIILKRWGITATLVESGEEATKLVKGVAYDIILMDVQMPGMDGFETTRVIREWEASQPGRRQSHIVALTALAMAGDKSRCLEAGMNDYLSKPIKPEALRKAIQYTLAK